MNVCAQQSDNIATHFKDVRHLPCQLGFVLFFFFRNKDSQSSRMIYIIDLLVARADSLCNSIIDSWASYKDRWEMSAERAKSQKCDSDTCRGTVSVYLQDEASARRLYE